MSERLALLVLMGALAGCELSLAPTFFPVLSSMPGRACGEGFQSPDGLRCEPVFAAGPCAPGTRPRLGNLECVPVGWTTCPPGFEPDTTGWGCAPQLPAALCQGATQARLGSTRCEPVGDCAAAFPPATATRFVDPAGPSDATHFTTIGQAISSAPAETVVAVADGRYAEALSITRAVTLVGRCAASVTLVSPGGNSPGVRVAAGGRLTLQGFTLSGHLNALVVDAAGTAVVERCVLDANRDLQVLVKGALASLTLRDSVVRDGVPQAGPSWGRGLMVQEGGEAVLDGVGFEHNQTFAVAAVGEGHVSLRRCVVRGTAPSNFGDGIGLVVEGAGARADVTESAFLDNQGRAISVKVGALQLERSLVQDTTPRPSGKTGWGLSVAQGGSADVTSSGITGNREVGISVSGVGSRVTLTDSVVNRTTSTDFGEVGIEATDGTTLSLVRTAVVGNTAAGLSVFGTRATMTGSLVAKTLGNRNQAATGVNLQAGATLDATDSALVANASLGMLVSETNPSIVRESTFDRVLVLDSVPLDGGGPGRGASLQGGQAAFTACAFVGNSEVAISVRSPGGRVRLTDSVIANTRADLGGRFGFGAVVRDGARWESTNSDLRQNAAVGLAISNAGGFVDRGLVSDQPVGLQVQDGSLLSAVVALSGALDGGTLEVTQGTAFVNNGSKIGAGNIPLPPP